MLQDSSWVEVWGMVLPGVGYRMPDWPIVQDVGVEDAVVVEAVDVCFVVDEEWWVDVWVVDVDVVGTAVAAASSVVRMVRACRYMIRVVVLCDGD